MKRRSKPRQARLIITGDLPLFSGVAPKGDLQPFVPPEDNQPRMPGLDWQPTLDELAAVRDKIIRPKRRRRS